MLRGSFEWPCAIPVTFVIGALLILLVTPLVLNAKEYEQRFVLTREREIEATVDHIEHIRSTPYDGIGGTCDVLPTERFSERWSPNGDGDSPNHFQTTSGVPIYETWHT